MKNKIKTLTKVWWKYFIVTYTLYGLSESLKENVKVKLNNMRAKKNGEDPGEIVYEHLWFTAGKNFKKVITMFKEYMEES